MAIGPAIAALAGTQPTSTFSVMTIEDLARECVAEIRRIQPDGPYQIAGFSFGGRIALEVAQQLRAAGAAVRQLVIFDTYMPGAYRRRPLRWFALHLSRALRGGPRYLAAAARQRWGPPQDAAPRDESAERSFAHRDHWFRLHLRTRYRPQPFPAPVVLFRATAEQVEPHYRIDPLRGWGAIARGPITAHDVDCRHLEILDQRRTPEVAEALRLHLSA